MGILEIIGGGVVILAIAGKVATSVYDRYRKRQYDRIERDKALYGSSGQTPEKGKTEE